MLKTWDSKSSIDICQDFGVYIIEYTDLNYLYFIGQS